MKRSLPALLVAWALVLTVLSCTPDAPPGSQAVTVTDSAGVQIVQSSVPSWGEEGAWALTDAPVLDIGQVEGDPAYQLYRVLDVTRLSDGRIVVANYGTNQLRFYDDAGVHLMDAGRTGEGPGEFQNLSRVWTVGDDSIVAFDSGNRRVTVFDAEGMLVRTTVLRADTIGFPSAQDGFGDGSILTVSARGGYRGEQGLIEGTLWFYSRFSADGVLLNRVAEAKEGDRWGFQFERRTASPYLPLVLGIAPSGQGEESFFLGEGSAPEVHELGTDGSLRRIIRWNAAQRAVTPEVEARYREFLHEAATDEEERRWDAAWVDEVPFPDFMPPYQTLEVDELGYVWVEQYRTPWETEPVWWIFDPEGRWLGELSVPAGLRVDEIGSDYVLGVRRDDFDVEHVTMYALERGE